MSDEDCWCIIRQKAFAPGGALESDSRMTDIGKSIAKQCCGVPLVAKTLGGLMHLRNKGSDWVSIRQNKNFASISKDQNNVISILKLSYDNLSPSLKQCFSICSIFPKDYWRIKRQFLIHLWMAEGFLQPFEEDAKWMEDLGDEYFNNLLSNSFYHDVEKDVHGNIKSCKIHDLLYDLAISVTGKHEHSLSLAKDIKMKDASEVRRLGLVFKDESLTMLREFLRASKKVRTLLLFEQSHSKDIELICRNSHLRVLDLTGLSISESLITSISRLRHLRYLNLSSPKDCHIKILHDRSIGALYNLQTLGLI